jgi:transposase InsO family protein
MGLYKKEKRELQQQVEAELIVKQVELIRKDQPRIGVRKLQVKLQETMSRCGIKIGRDGLFDLLREFDMLVKQKRYRHYTTNSKHSFYKYPNLVKQLRPARPGQLWVSDITYIEVSGRFYYLFLITDACSKKIVGYKLSESYSVKGALEALQMALKNNKIEIGLIHHSDRGIQYCCLQYTSLLKRKGIVISMTENSDPYENAIAERVNGILKTELLQAKYPDAQTAKLSVGKAISIYNNERPHMSIGMLTPVQAHELSTTMKQMWTKKQYAKQGSY